MRKPHQHRNGREAAPVPNAPRTGRCGPTGKVRYRSRGAALYALELLQERAVDDGDRRREQRAYRCWYCDGFHLTSQIKNPKPVPRIPGAAR